MKMLLKICCHHEIRARLHPSEEKFLTSIDHVVLYYLVRKGKILMFLLLMFWEDLLLQFEINFISFVIEPALRKAPKTHRTTPRSETAERKHRPSAKDRVRNPRQALES